MKTNTVNIPFCFRTTADQVPSVGSGNDNIRRSSVALKFRGKMESEKYSGLKTHLY